MTPVKKYKPLNASSKVLVLNGPNLNMLGQRERDVYGTTTLAEIESALRQRGGKLGVEIEFFQSNSESELIDRLHSAPKSVAAVIFNPGAFTHTSVALHDAVASIAPLP